MNKKDPEALRVHIVRHSIYLLMGLFSLGLSGSLFAERTDALSGSFYIHKPNGDGPYPAVVLVSGSCGFNSPRLKPVYDDVQNRLREMGFVVIRSAHPTENVKNTCFRISMSLAVSNLKEAVSYIRSQPYVKQQSINVIGWSFGGEVALVALSDHLLSPVIDVGAIVTYYPRCRSVQKWQHRVPVLLLAGEKDQNISLTQCHQVFEMLPESTSVKVHVYPDAYHAFDAFNLPKELKLGRVTIGYNAEAANAAWTEVERFLKR